MAEKILQINHLSKSFGSNVVLRDIDFDVCKGDVTSIIGASGSGKSTLLRCINLLETPSSGEILYHNKNVADRKVSAAEYRSHVGMVFQSFNLFNNMTVLDNCMVGQIKVLKKKKEEAQKAAMYYLIWYDSCLPQIADAKIQTAAESAPAMLMALETGAVDFVCTDMPTGQGALVAYDDLVLLDFAGSGDDFTVSDEDVNIGISLRKGNTVLKDALDAVLSGMTADDFNAMMADAIAVQPIGG